MRTTTLLTVFNDHLTNENNSGCSEVVVIDKTNNLRKHYKLESGKIKRDKCILSLTTSEKESGLVINEIGFYLENKLGFGNYVLKVNMNNTLRDIIGYVTTKDNVLALFV